MKKAILFVFCTTLVYTATTILTTNSEDSKLAAYSSGPPAGRTGSPGDGGNCTSCHGGPAAQTQSGWITSNIPASGYVPLTTYTITATAVRANHSKFGFQISPQNASGTQIGTLGVISAAQTQLVGGTKYIEHTNGGTSGVGSKTWTFNWTAPASGTGSFTFYGAFNITNSSISSAGDTIYLSTLAVSEAIPFTATATGTNLNCNGVCSGTASVAFSGGAGGYSFLWNTVPPSITQSVSGLCAGTYNVTITDQLGATATSSYTVTQPTALSASVPNHTNVSCFGGNNGIATASATGGTGNYSYSWNTNPVQTTQTASNLPQGTYTVTVTDALGCSTTSSVSITQPTALSASIPNHTNVSCFGGNNGSATVTPNGGTTGYSYSWNTSPVQTTQTANNLSQGTYTATVTDALGCSNTSAVSITQPTALSASIPNHTNVSCFGGNNGSATVTPSGGTTGYSYSWNTSPVQTTQTASNLPQGTYSATVTDALGCVTTATVSITQPTSLAVGAGNDVAFCQGFSAAIGGNPSALGGTIGYSYSWSPLSDLSAANVANPTVLSTINQTTTYTLTVTDGNGCTASDDMIVTVTSAATAIASATDTAFCPGDSVEISANQGTAYLWTNGETTQSIYVNQANDYSLVVTNPGGCVGDATSNVVTITQNPAPAIPVISQTGNVLSSTPASGYQWYLGGGELINEFNPDYTIVQNGDYQVEITDANGCKAISAIFSVLNVGLTEAEYSSPLNVYPNPANGNLFIAFPKAESVTLKLTSVFGKIVLVKDFDKASSQFPIELSTDGLSKGIYLLQVCVGGDQNFSKKVYLE